VESKHPKPQILRTQNLRQAKSGDGAGVIEDEAEDDDGARGGGGGRRRGGGDEWQMCVSRSRGKPFWYARLTSLCLISDHVLFRWRYLAECLISDHEMFRWRYLAQCLISDQLHTHTHAHAHAHSHAHSHSHSHSHLSDPFSHFSLFLLLCVLCALNRYNKYTGESRWQHPPPSRSSTPPPPSTPPPLGAQEAPGGPPEGYEPHPPPRARERPPPPKGRNARLEARMDMALSSAHVMPPRRPKMSQRKGSESGSVAQGGGPEKSTGSSGVKGVGRVHRVGGGGAIFGLEDMPEGWVMRVTAQPYAT
jgi:hypothetical protein